MSLVRATYLINDNTNTEKFVVNLPSDYQYLPGERLIERFIEEDLYNRLATNIDDKLKIYRYVNPDVYDDHAIAPKGLDYKVGLNIRLHPKPTMEINGFLSKMEYYADIELVNGAWVYKDLILDATFSYYKDKTTGFVFHRTKTVTWYREDGTAHPDKKVMFKVYNPTEMDDEAIQRRSNVISVVKVELAEFIKQLVEVQYPNSATRPNSNDISKKVIGPFSLPILNYINAGDKSAIIAALNSSKETLLSTQWPKYGKSVKEVLIDRIVNHG